MCELCHHVPCMSSCPNAPEPKHVFICSGCGESICIGDEYYDIMGEQFCVDCMSDARRTAEWYDDEE